MNPIKPLLATIPALAVAGALLLGGGAAAAAPGPTPNNLTGAANMVNTNAKASMYQAMATNNPNGDTGMWCAVYITTGAVPPGPCVRP